MPDDQVTISTKSFAFHYVTKTTGEIDGLSFLTQTEDALNDIGRLAQSAYNSTVVSNEQVQQALSIANTANNNASNALATANKASGDVATLTITVTEISQQTQSAVSTSQSALQNSTQALSQSQQAVTTSNEAKTIAQEAVTDTSAAEQRVNQAAQTAQENAQIAQNSAQGALNSQTQAQTAATSAQNSVEQAQKWATWMGDGESADETVDGTDYSAKWWAQHAEDIVNDVVHISAQTLTQEQKNQVWSNIGLSNSSETVSGVIQIATNSDAQTGTNNTKALSPLKAFANFVSLNAQTLSETIQTQVLTNLGVFDALEELITEYGGTVPASVNTASTQSTGTDPWAELS